MVLLPKATVPGTGVKSMMAPSALGARWVAASPAPNEGDDLRCVPCSLPSQTSLPGHTAHLGISGVYTSAEGDLRLRNLHTISTQ
jgi:hypothetical protein